MRYSRPCTSNGFRAAGPRCGGFSSVMISPIKKSLCAAERHRKDVARARRRWIQQQGFLDTTRLVFIDETAITTNMVRVRGRCPRGERLVSHVPQGERKTITFIAGLRHNKMTSPMVIERAMDGPAFLSYIKECLGPTLKPGDTVVMDHCPIHKVSGVEEAIEACGARVEYLPKYSPDLNPIEFQQIQSLFAKVCRADCSYSIPTCWCFRTDTFSCRMPQLLPPRRLRVNLTGIRYNYNSVTKWSFTLINIDRSQMLVVTLYSTNFLSISRICQQQSVSITKHISTLEIINIKLFIHNRNTLTKFR